MRDYDRIARAIHYLDAQRNHQPDLATLAAQVELSPAHLHRLFHAWAGVTPKAFLQCLTLNHARRRLRAGDSVLTAAIDSGLSGPGRLHDLCVHLEAASPGELKSGGAGWVITAGFAETPFGTCLIGQGPRGICHLAFVEPDSEHSAWDELARSWPAARLQRDDTQAESLATQIFTCPPPARAPLRAYVRGNAFQLKVWRALLRIPFGTVVSYSQLAANLDSRAVRAVGSAVAQNPLAYLIPCHRVIRKTGISGEYRWGTTRKKALLAWEHSRQSRPAK